MHRIFLLSKIYSARGNEGGAGDQARVRGQRGEEVQVKTVFKIQFLETLTPQDGHCSAHHRH